MKPTEAVVADEIEDERWRSHMAMHARDQQVLSDTAARLATSVENTKKALETQADIHARNHDKEHHAHERIHVVEKEQRDRERETMDDRLDGMNEFRDQLRDQATTFVRGDRIDEIVSRMEERATAAAKAHEAKLEGLEKQFNEYKEQQSKFSSELWTEKTSAHSALQQSMDTRFGQIEKRMAEEAGQKAGSRLTVGTLFASLAAAATVIGIIVVIVNVLTSH